jgi:hypothetical protein
VKGERDMTDNEIIKALECCISSSTSLACFKCPMAKNKECNGSNTNVNKLVVEDALDLINRQKAELENQNLEIDILIRKKETLRDEISALSAEVERLKDRNRKCIYLSDEETSEHCVDSICPKFITEEQIKSEAIREFAKEVVDEKFSNYDKTDDILVYDIQGRIYEFAESYINRTVGDDNG